MSFPPSATKRRRVVTKASLACRWIESGRITPAHRDSPRKGRRKSESWTGTTCSPSSLPASSHTVTLGSDKLVPSGTRSSKRSAVESDRPCLIHNHVRITRARHAAAVMARRFMEWPPPHHVHGPTMCRTQQRLPLLSCEGHSLLWDG